MPIRINLLAEHLEAEDARRRDPVKRAIWIGGAVVLLVILWSASLQLEILRGRGELHRHQSRLLDIEARSKDIRAEWSRIGEVERRMTGLTRYSTNRFHWATVMDALQRAVVQNVRLVTLESAHVYSTNAETRFRTNLTYALPQKSRWSFWSSAQPPNALQQLDQQLGSLTNRADFTTNRVPPVVKIDVKTNETQVVAAVEIIKPATATERIIMTLDARDYGDPPGRLVDEFSKKLAAEPHFMGFLEKGEGQGMRLRERAIHPELDALDPVLPGRSFIPFSIECRYEERVRPNE